MLSHPLSQVITLVRETKICLRRTDRPFLVPCILISELLRDEALTNGPEIRNSGSRSSLAAKLAGFLSLIAGVGVVVADGTLPLEQPAHSEKQLSKERKKGKKKLVHARTLDVGELERYFISDNSGKEGRKRKPKETQDRSSPKETQDRSSPKEKSTPLSGKSPSSSLKRAASSNQKGYFHLITQIVRRKSKRRPHLQIVAQRTSKGRLPRLHCNGVDPTAQLRVCCVSQSQRL